MAKKKPSQKKLTVKQQRFIDAYEGNATAAARKAGYKNPESSSKYLVRLDTIKKNLKIGKKDAIQPLFGPGSNVRSSGRTWQPVNSQRPV